MYKMSWAFLTTFCLSALLGASWTAAVKSGSAYTGVTVAIHKNISEDATIIENIKNQFSAASRLLYDATGGWAYYKEIIIAVPSTWKSSTYTKIYNDPYQRAEFRIDSPNRQYGDQPYTLQPGGCGESGEYVHLTPAFLSARSGISDKFGLPERIIVHEWSHLRYGVFDEYGIPGDPKFPLFYFDNGFIAVSVCSEDVKGYMESNSGNICSVYEDEVSSDCVFVPDMDDNKTRASIMSLPYMPTVDRYCTKGTANSGHNWRAPTKQNLLCNRRSAWEVISAHADFATQRNTGEPFTAPNFKIVRVEPLAPRYVFVLDVSGSMQGAPLELMKRSANWFVKDLVKDHSYVGVVTFHSTASVIQPMTLINGLGPRAAVQAKIQSMVANGGTSVGSGLQAALQALRSANLPTEDALLIVITDGVEGNKPVIGDVIGQVEAAKAKALAIAFGRSASLDLERLGLVSGGKSVLIPNIQGTSTADLDQVFVEATVSQTDVDVQIIQLMNKPFTLTKEVTETAVTLDHELGKNAVFTITGLVAQLDMELISPNGRRYVGSDSLASRDNARIQFKMPTAESGVWKVILRKKTGGTVTVDIGVVSEPRNPSDHPVRVRAWLNAAEVKHGESTVKVYSHVTKGSNAVIRAPVEAVVVSDNGRKIIITPKDDGSGADAVADDGIYTAYFVQFAFGEKRYTVTAQVENRGQAFIKASKFSASPMIARKKPRITPKGPPTQKFRLDQFQVLDQDPDAAIPVGDPAADFERTVTAGSFTLKDFKQQDTIKPSAINDLSVASTGESKDGKKYIVLKWTAPGDDLDSGTPSKLDFRVSVQGDRFVRDFSTGHLIEALHLKESSLTPQAGGSKQTLTFYLPDELFMNVPATKSLDVYISAKATDKSGNVADLGNIAVAHFGYEIPICLQKTGLFPKARACDQFYHCSNGEPYLKTCPIGLHYSAASMRCEWPCSAKCDPRISCSGN